MHTNSFFHKLCLFVLTLPFLLMVSSATPSPTSTSISDTSSQNGSTHGLVDIKWIIIGILILGISCCGCWLVYYVLLSRKLSSQFIEKTESIHQAINNNKLSQMQSPKRADQIPADPVSIALSIDALNSAIQRYEGKYALHAKSGDGHSYNNLNTSHNDAYYNANIGSNNHYQIPQSQRIMSPSPQPQLYNNSRSTTMTYAIHPQLYNNNNNNNNSGIFNIISNSSQSSKNVFVPQALPARQSKSVSYLAQQNQYNMNNNNLNNVQQKQFEIQYINQVQAKNNINNVNNMNGINNPNNAPNYNQSNTSLPSIPPPPSHPPPRRLNVPHNGNRLKLQQNFSSDKAPDPRPSEFQIQRERNMTLTNHTKNSSSSSSSSNSSNSSSSSSSSNSESSKSADSFTSISDSKQSKISKISKLPSINNNDMEYNQMGVVHKEDSEEIIELEEIKNANYSYNNSYKIGHDQMGVSSQTVIFKELNEEMTELADLKNKGQAKIDELKIKSPSFASNNYDEIEIKSPSYSTNSDDLDLEIGHLISPGKDMRCSSFEINIEDAASSLKSPQSTKSTEL